MRLRMCLFVTLLLAPTVACQSSPPEPAVSESAPKAQVSVSPHSRAVSHSATGAEGEPDAVTLPRGVSPKPEWLGKRLLTVDADGLGIARRTPKILRDRRLVTEDLLPPPEKKGFMAISGPVPPDVLRRSTWRPGCPVEVEDLSYLQMSFWGFDERRHTGEMIVNEEVADEVLRAFRMIYRSRWPIEEMRVTTRRELDAAPTGDGNNTSAFVCRKANLSAEWSQHAYGLAVDINPFHNPYVREHLTLPELAISYRERDRRRPGMIRPSDPVSEAFGRIGWGWGGLWSSSKDWMHFSSNGY